MERGRRRERTRLIYHLRVFEGGETGELLGHVMDLTAEGMMLLGERKLSEEKPIEARMTLPANVMGGGSLHFRAIVKWSRPEPDAEFYTSGLEVTGIDSHAAETITHLIEQFYQEPGEDLPDDDLEKYI